jgi:hypothetical protein
MHQSTPKTPTIILADNGSRRAASVLNLRKLAHQLSLLSHHQISPVSLQHAHHIPAEKLEGKQADILQSFLRQKLGEGERNFLLIPLFFGVSKALTTYIPEQMRILQAEFGPFTLQQSDVLYPLPQGEPRLAQILFAQLSATIQGEKPQQVILVDHGSPLPQVSEVRKRIAQDLQRILESNVSLAQAVMERRDGVEYDFNGELLETMLLQVAETTPKTTLDLVLLFVSPGRHAGPGGDIEQICQRLKLHYPDLNIRISPLVGQHAALLDILHDRLNTALRSRQASHSIKIPLDNPT